MVTMAVSVAVCEIFSVKEWCDLENRVRVRSRSLKWHYLIDRIRVLFAFHSKYGDILYRLVENRKIFIPHLYLAPPTGGDRVGIS